MVVNLIKFVNDVIKDDKSQIHDRVDILVRMSMMIYCRFLSSIQHALSRKSAIDSEF